MDGLIWAIAGAFIGYFLGRLEGALFGALIAASIYGAARWWMMSYQNDPEFTGPKEPV